MRNEDKAVKALLNGPRTEIQTSTERDRVVGEFFDELVEVEIIERDPDEEQGEPLEVHAVPDDVCADLRVRRGKRKAPAKPVAETPEDAGDRAVGRGTAVNRSRATRKVGR